MAEGWPHSQEAPSGELLTLAAFSPQSTSSAHITPAPGPPSPSPFCASRVHPEDTGAGKPGPGLGSLGQGWSGQCPDSSWPPQLQRFLPCRWLSASILSSANPSSCTTWRSSSQPAGQGLARSLSLPACCSWPCSAVGNTPPQVHPLLPQPGRALCQHPGAGQPAALPPVFILRQLGYKRYYPYLSVAFYIAVI